MNDAFEIVDTYNTKVVIKIISINKSNDNAIRNIEKQIDGVDFVYFDAIENIREMLNDTDMVFLIGATDDSKLNEIAEITDELNILTIAIVTKSLSFDAKNITQLLCEDELNAIAGITNLIVNAGMINVDLDDIHTILFGKTAAISSSGSAVGRNRAKEATEQALASPLFSIMGVKTFAFRRIDLSSILSR